MITRETAAACGMCLSGVKDFLRRNKIVGESISLEDLKALAIGPNRDFEWGRILVVLAQSRTNGVVLDLSGVDLSWADLSGVNLHRANLSGANMSGANLYGSNLSYSNLSGANLSEANLYGSNLSYSNLSGANLSEANLSEADLRTAHLFGADLSGADLSEADLSGANLSGADLSEAPYTFDPLPPYVQFWENINVLPCAAFPSGQARLYYERGNQ